MSDVYNLIKRKFQHIVLDGDYYEIGRQQGVLLKANAPEFAKKFVSGSTDSKKLGFERFEDLQHHYEEFCPGITDEIEGLADSLGAKPDRLPVYGPPIYEPANCSQISVLSTASKNNHVYVGRSYEFHHEMNDFRLCTTRIKGKIKHIGFSEFLIFRDEGMNDHGFCVSISGGGTFKAKPTKKGFPFFLIVRSLLDNCKSIDDAIAYLEKIPVHGYWNFLLTDQKSNTALVQFFDSDYAVQRISQESQEPFLFSGNHYRIPEMEKYQEYAGDWILANSKKRCDLIGSTLREAYPEIEKETLRKLLSEEIYDGLAGHYYTDYFGTLFSLIFDLTELNVDVCFGTPTHNSWRDPITFDGPAGVNHFDAKFPNKSIETDELWIS